VVLEARDRVGGRLHTVDLAGVPVDLGGSWIHHPIGNPLSKFCDEYGIARDPGTPSRCWRPTTKPSGAAPAAANPLGVGRESQPRNQRSAEMPVRR
jgi:monoamine oxidase